MAFGGSCRAVPGLVIAAGLLLVGAAAPAAFTTFETGPVRPLALSPDGNTLFAVNTPDGRLEILAVGAGGLTHTGSVPVGLEPCAVAARSNGEVWVFAQQGLQKLRLKGGAPGRGKLLARAGGASLTLSAAAGPTQLLAQQHDVTVQLVSDAGGRWESVFPPTAVSRNQPDFYRTKR